MALENRLKEYRARLGTNQADLGRLEGEPNKQEYPDRPSVLLSAGITRRQ